MDQNVSTNVQCSFNTKICRVILVTNSTSKVIPAIRSRCLAVRVAAPSLEDIAKIITVMVSLRIGSIKKVFVSDPKQTYLK
jgi:hypothetical protein